MGKYRVGYLVFLLIATVLVAPGCFRGGSGNNLQQTPPVAAEALTNVRLVIGGEAANQAIRAQTALPPQVYFELRLLDRSNSSMPIIRFRKQAQVVSSESGYTASALFENIPVMPAIASMSINGGYLPGVGDQPFKIWVGKKELVAAAENEITLVGSGDKSATDVSINLLERLIAAPANVATLAIPIFTRVDEIVAGLNLSSVNVYEEAYSAYNAAYAPLPVPADAEFQPPAGYASIAYPKKDSSLNLTIPAFGSASESWVLLMNRSTANATPNWSVTNAGAGSVRASVSENGQFTRSAANSGLPSSAEYNFHLKLRAFQKPAAVPVYKKPEVRASLRPVVINDQLTFKAYVKGETEGEVVFGSVSARCRQIFDHGGGKFTYIFVDVNDLGVSGVENVLSGLLTAWSSASGIYNTNRQIFGEEPPGTYNSWNVDDYNANADIYVLISRQIYTAGYFWSADLFPANLVPESNYRKLFYLQLDNDLSDAVVAVNRLASTMAHEFQHMIHYWQKRKLSTDSYNANGWVDEAMSGYAEHINGFRIENQKNQSKALQANKYFELIKNIMLDKWHLDSDSYDVQSAYYGKAFLFGVWLAQNYGAGGVVQNLLSVQATEKAAIEAFTGESFDITFAKFMLAMAVNDSINGGIYGFKDLDLTETYSYGDGWAPVTLTGPAKTEVNAVTGGSGGVPVAPYCAAYIRITGGNGSNVNLGATLPTNFALFQLHR